MKKLTREETNSLEYRLFKRNSPVIVCSAGIVIATDAFWLVLSSLNSEIGAIHNISLRICFAIAIFLCLVIGVLSLVQIKKKNYKKLRYSILALDTLLAIEVALMCISYNILSPTMGISSLFYVPLSSLYLFIVVYIPLVRPCDSAYALFISALSVILPCFTPGRENYIPLPGLVMLSCIAIAYVIYRHLLLSHVDSIKRLKEQKEQYMNLTNESLETVAATIDAKNKYLDGHSKRVADYSQRIAVRMGLPQEDCEKIYFSGLLHDIGKIGVSNSILDKDGKLTDSEYENIKRHSSMGCDILSRLNVIPELAMSARCHHERYDGTGYPDGLSGEEIPLYARIISVCDAYDAMSSKRSYREPLTREAIIAEIKRCRGTQFDPKVADVIIEILTEKEQEQKENRTST